MIKLHRLNGQSLVVNAEHIEMLEETPEVVLVLTTGRRLVVQESIDEVIAASIAYRRACDARRPLAEASPAELNDVRGLSSRG